MLQSSLLYNSIKWDYIAFLHLVKVVRNVLRTNAKFDPKSVKQNFCRSVWMLCTTCMISLLPGIMKLKKQSGREEIFQNNEKSSEIDNKTHR